MTPEIKSGRFSFFYYFLLIKQWQTDTEEKFVFFMYDRFPALSFIDQQEFLIFHIFFYLVNNFFLRLYNTRRPEQVGRLGVVVPRRRRLDGDRRPINLNWVIGSLVSPPSISPHSPV